MKDPCAAALEFRIGDKVPGTNWVVRRVLGRGGMGVVLGVGKEASGLRMAMKVVRPDFAESEDFIVRFSDEVRLLARLRHPNIVEVTDCDTLADGSPYIMMEWLEGRTLREALSDPGIALTAENVWRIIEQLCSALGCAHSSVPPIVHRDVKPGNVFLYDRKHFASSVKLIDFGISAVVDGKRATGAPMGTARYMSPEACRGEAPTPQVDIYALGILCYEALTRRLPWDFGADRSAEAIMHAHLNLEPAAPSRRVGWVSKSVDDCLLRALSKDPARRQRDAREFLQGLGELPFLDDGSGNHRSEGVTAPTPETLARGRATARPPGRPPALRRPSSDIRVDVLGPVEGAPGKQGGPEPSSAKASPDPAIGSEVQEPDGAAAEPSSLSSRDESDTPMSSAAEPKPRTRRKPSTALVAVAAAATLAVGAAAVRWKPDTAARSGPPATLERTAAVAIAPVGAPVRVDLVVSESLAAQPMSARDLVAVDSGSTPVDVAVARKPASRSRAAPERRAASPSLDLWSEIAEPSKPKTEAPKAKRPLSDEELLFVPGGKK
jgi:serine/threonine protein kinase